VVVLGVMATVLAVLVTAVVVFIVLDGRSSDSAAGGSSTTTTSQAPQDARGLLAAAAEQTAALDSVHVDLETSGYTGLTPRRMSADVTQRPSPAAKGDMTLLLSDQPIDIQFVAISGRFYFGVGTGGRMDELPGYDAIEPAKQLDPQVGLANLVEGFRDATIEGTESVDGVSATRISGEISADAVNDFMRSANAQSAVPAQVWIAEDDQRLVRILIEPTAKTRVDATLSDWDEPVSIQRP
jgi:lipoprotein LprG